jgi:Carboxypeptidase regulatory-like domain
MVDTERAQVLLARQPDESKVYAPTFYPGTMDKRQALKVSVHPGDEVSANFNLITTRTFNVRGSVSGVGLKPPDASRSVVSMVTLESPDDPLDQHFAGTILPNGTFEVTGVFPASYRAVIDAANGDPSLTLRASQTVDVRDADIDGLQLSPEPPSQIRGRFRMDATDNQSPDWTQLNVQIDPDDHDSQTNAVTGKVAKDGSFNVEASSRDYHLIVTTNSNGEYWRDFIVKEVVLNGKDVGDSGFSLTGGLTSLEIVAGAQGSSIEGNVVDEDGKPVAGVSVVCIPDASRRTRRDIYQQVQTDRQGHFSIRGLNPGEYQVFAVDDPADDITDPDFVAAHETGGQAVTLDAGERKGVVLHLPAESQP